MSIPSEEGVPTPANLMVHEEQEEEPTQEYTYPAEYYYPMTYDYSGEAWNPNPYTFAPCYPAYYPYFNEFGYDETYLYYEGDPNYGCNYSWGSGEISAEELSEEMESGDVRPAARVETYKQQKPVEKKAPRGPRPPRQSNRGKNSKTKKGKQPPENTKKYHEAQKYHESRPKVHYRQVVPKVEKVAPAPLCIGIPEVAGAMWADVDPDEEMDFSVSVYGNAA